LITLGKSDANIDSYLSVISQTNFTIFSLFITFFLNNQHFWYNRYKEMLNPLEALPIPSKIFSIHFK
jgi:hypothetical protein